MSRLTRVGAGTSAPGVVIERFDPEFVRRRGRRLGDGIVLVSGTNGKTTTAAMIAAALGSNGRSVLTNPSGANLFRGVATALVTAKGDERVGVFEVDEGALPGLVRTLEPRVLVLTNVFRDQLDRFGEPETVARLLADAARAMPAGSAVVANADDPLLWHAVAELHPTGFGVRVRNRDATAHETDGEPEVCPACGGPVRHRERTFAHLGVVTCDSCRWASNSPAVLAEVVDHPRIDWLRLSLGGRACDLRLGGVHNAYNAAAAVAAAGAMGVSTVDAARALDGFVPRFGRTESLDLDGRTLWVLLMKNPA
ncbi:MAG TPA: Mur ligase family protein, partial [Actinomycetota bacterium]|nr:Mur ligase family protein [Actinomycetota bacterium]